MVQKYIRHRNEQGEFAYVPDNSTRLTDSAFMLLFVVFLSYCCYELKVTLPEQLKIASQSELKSIIDKFHEVIEGKSGL